MPEVNTFHNRFDIFLRDLSIPNVKSRVNEVAGALFYTYIWGWYTGFIEMPYYSIQGLLSNPPVNLHYDATEMTQDMYENQDVLRRYRLLSSLFFDESDPEFAAKNFGFLTPLEAFDEYEHLFDSRFDGYFGRALGEFLELIPTRYQ